MIPPKEVEFSEVALIWLALTDEYELLQIHTIRLAFVS